MLTSKEQVIKEVGESPEVVKVFSDESCIEGRVGAAAVLYREGEEIRSVRKHLGTEEEHTVFEVEVIGLILAAELVCIERGAGSIILDADNKAALKATRRTKGALGQNLWTFFTSKWSSCSRDMQELRGC